MIVIPKKNSSYFFLFSSIHKQKHNLAVEFQCKYPWECRSEFMTCVAHEDIGYHESLKFSELDSSSLATRSTRTTTKSKLKWIVDNEQISSYFCRTEEKSFFQTETKIMAALYVLYISRSLSFFYCLYKINISFFLFFLCR